MSDRDNVSTGEMLTLLLSAPTPRPGWSLCFILTREGIATRFPRRAPAAGCCAGSPRGRELSPGGLGLCLLASVAAFVTDQSPPPERSLTPFPCDTVMGCDMVFVGLLLMFCSPLTQQAWPLQGCVAQSPFISALLFALAGARRRHLETDTGGTTSARHPPRPGGKFSRANLRSGHPLCGSEKQRRNSQSTQRLMEGSSDKA